MLTDVRSYIRARAKAVGLTEWTDAFNVENIPSTLLNKSFHMEMGTATALKREGRDVTIDYPVLVSIAVKGYRTPAEAVDSAISLSQQLTAEAMDPTLRYTQTSIKDVFMESLAIDPLATSNDNVVVAALALRVRGVLSVE